MIHIIQNDLTRTNKRGNMKTIGGLVMLIDDMFKREEKKIRKLYDTKLLSELLLLNYQYSNSEYLGTTAEDVYNSLCKKNKYTKKEKEQLIKNAIQLLNIEHGINVINYEELNFDVNGNIRMYKIVHFYITFFVHSYITINNI